MSELSIKDQFAKDVLGDDYKAPEESKPVTETKTEDQQKKEPVSESQGQKEELDITDDKLLAFLKQRGISVDSVEELKKPTPQKTEEERQAEQRKRKQDALVWGIQTNRIKKEEYDELTRIQVNKMDLVIDEFVDYLKEKSPDLTEEEIQEKVNEYTLSHYEDTDPLKIKRQNDLLELADKRLKKKFSSIYNLDREFDAYEQTQISEKELQAKVAQQTPIYKSNLEKVVDECKAWKHTIEDSQNPDNNLVVDLTFSEDDLKEVREAFSNSELVLQKIRNGFNVEDITNEVRSFLLIKHAPRLFNKIAKDYNSVQKEKYMMARKGIVQKDLHVSSESAENPILDQFRKDVLAAEAAN